MPGQGNLKHVWKDWVSLRLSSSPKNIQTWEPLVVDSRAARNTTTLREAAFFWVVLETKKKPPVSGGSQTVLFRYCIPEHGERLRPIRRISEDSSSGSTRSCSETSEASAASGIHVGLINIPGPK